jgi:hypothetical protein
MYRPWYNTAPSLKHCMQNKKSLVPQRTSLHQMKSLETAALFDGTAIITNSSMKVWAHGHQQPLTCK